MTLRFAIALAATVGAVSAQAVIWDDFTDGTTNFNVQSGMFGSLNAASVPGGDRLVFGEVLSNPSNQFYDVSVAGGQFTNSSGFGLVGGSILYYGIATFTPPNFISFQDMNVNVLAAGDRFRLNFLGNDLPMTVQFYVANNLQSGVGFQSGTQTVNVGASGSPFSVDALFSNFSGSVDFSTLDQLRIQFNTGFTPNHDFALGSVEVVPEPASMATLGLGALTLLRRRRTRKPSQG